MDNTQEVTAVEPHRHTTRRMRPPHYIEGKTMTDVDLRRMLETEAAEAKSKKFLKGLMLASAVVILVVLSSGVSLLYGMNLMASFGTTRTEIVPVASSYYGPGYIYIRVPKDSSAVRKLRLLNRILEDKVILEELRAANPNIDLDHIQAGQSIRVPVYVSVRTDENGIGAENVIRRETTEFPSVTLGDWFGKNDDWRDQTHVW